MYEIIDKFCWTKEVKTITKDRHQIPGLGNFSHWNLNTATHPLPMHYHSNIIEFHCMIKGSRFSQIERNGKLTNYITTGNQVFLSYPFEVHGNGDEPQMPHEFYGFQIITSDPEHLLGLNENFSYSLYSHLMNLRGHQFNLSATHINNIRSAFNFFSELNPDSVKIGIQFLTCFLFTLEFLTPVHETSITTVDPSIKKSIDYLNENIFEPMQVSDLASISGYSLSRFKVRFKEEIGITPAEYITLQKLELAKKQLIESNVSITDLAYHLGFSSVSYFSAVFKKMTFCTPLEYRKQHNQHSFLHN